MTKKEVAALFGPADDIRGSRQDEAWIYYLNVGKQLVPWNLGHGPEVRVIRFNESSRVQTWSQTK